MSLARGIADIIEPTAAATDLAQIVIVLNSFAVGARTGNSDAISSEHPAANMCQKGPTAYASLSQALTSIVEDQKIDALANMRAASSIDVHGSTPIGLTRLPVDVRDGRRARDVTEMLWPEISSSSESTGIGSSIVDFLVDF